MPNDNSRHLPFVFASLLSPVDFERVFVWACGPEIYNVNSLYVICSVSASKLYIEPVRMSDIGGKTGHKRYVSFLCRIS